VREGARSSARVRAGFRIAAALASGLAVLTPAVARASSYTLAGEAGSAPAGVALSNLHTLSRWGYPTVAAAVRQDPSSGSRVVGRLRFLTPDGQAQLYLALRSSTVGQLTWTLVSVPARPNGLTGWVPASALGELHEAREYLRVNRAALRAVLFRRGRAIWSAPVGVGRPGLPTPAGHFYVTEKLTPQGDPTYGPYALGTSAYSPTLTDWPGGGVVGIHGTDQPQKIPGRPSHGCIRLRDADMTRLWSLIEVGTPIEIV
jgi:hypothetical protein